MSAVNPISEDDRSVKVRSLLAKMSNPANASLLAQAMMQAQGCRSQSELFPSPAQTHTGTVERQMSGSVLDSTGVYSDLIDMEHMTPEELRNALATSIQETAAMKNVLAEATRQAMQATMAISTLEKRVKQITAALSSAATTAVPTTSSSPSRNADVLSSMLEHPNLPITDTPYDFKTSLSSEATAIALGRASSLPADTLPSQHMPDSQYLPLAIELAKQVQATVQDLISQKVLAQDHIAQLQQWVREVMAIVFEPSRQEEGCRMLMELAVVLDKLAIGSSAKQNSSPRAVVTHNTMDVDTA